MDYDVLIIGGGPSATFVIRGLVQDPIGRGRDSELRVAIIEPRDIAGAGAAWLEADPRMSTNMTVGSLAVYGAYLKETGDFDVHNATELFEGTSKSKKGTKSYLPRGTVGECLHQLYQETLVVAARHGVQVEHIKQGAVRIEAGDGGYYVTLDNGETIFAPCAAIALGLLSINRFPELQGAPGYISDSWANKQELSFLEGRKRVAIAGAGPTGIDWIIRAEGVPGVEKVYCISRSGKFPSVRPRVDPNIQMDPITPELIRSEGRAEPLCPRTIKWMINSVIAQAGVKQADLDELSRQRTGSSFDQFERSLAASSEQQPMFDALKMIDTMSPIVWNYANAEGRKAIRDVWAPMHRQLSFAIPPHTASHLADMINSGRVELHGGMSGKPTHDRGGFYVGFDDYELRADVLINATGSEGPISAVNNPLIRQMLQAGLLVEDADFQGALMDAQTGQAKDANGKLRPGLFIAGGSLTKGAVYMVNTLIGTSSLGLAVGRSIARELLNVEARRILERPSQIADPNQMQLPLKVSAEE